MLVSRTMRFWLLAAVWLAAVPGCSDTGSKSAKTNADAGNAGTTDATPGDAATTDAGAVPDAVNDGATTDADVESVDTGTTTDASAGDAVADTGDQGAAPQDVADLDAGTLDAGPPDAGTLDAVVDSAADAVLDGGSDAVADAGPDALADAGPDALADAGSDTADVAAPKAGVYGGHCTAPFPGPAKQAWNNPLTSPLVPLLGKPNHRIRDIILPVGSAGQLRGHFTYGVLDTNLGDENVELWVQTCPGWVSWGKLKTGLDGTVLFDVPANVPQGDYQVKIVMLGDLTVADGAIAIWPKSVQAVVTDVDGTLTTSDWQLIQDVIFGADAEMYPDANTVMQAWAKKDYRLVYLTGRPQLVNRYTRTWLATHGFPPGTLHLTEGVAQLPPTVDGVQAFKTEFLKGIQQTVGTLFKPAYGNATTDVGAYEAVAIGKADIWIIGTNAGYDGTQPVTDYTSHLPKIATYPGALQP